ncbi:MAG TPA: hypothetical protein VH188_09805 [Chthoniobacterales bacterium]|jgi:hypothetical protein|nr:hypothetical protein [Chthoniobacterales bacterium]
MTEENPSPPAAVSERQIRHRWPSIVAHRLIELVIVFVGVYAAFVLNAHQIHEQERQRRAQILSYLEGGAVQSLVKLKTVTPEYDRRINQFMARLEKGEMPEISPIAWSSSYNPNESAWLLQAGGLELLDIQTIARIRELDAAAATGLSTMAHYQQLSDQLIVPHLGEGQAAFYDLETKKLRPQYARYPDMLQDGSRVLHDIAEKTDALAAQLRAEQARHR